MSAKDRYNDACRLLDEDQRPAEEQRSDLTNHAKTFIRKAPLYCFDDFRAILQTFTYGEGLLCTLDRNVTLATDSRCVLVTITAEEDEPGAVRLIRHEIGTDVAQVTIHGLQARFHRRLGGALVTDLAADWRYSIIRRAATLDTNDADQQRTMEELRDLFAVIALLNHVDSPRHYVLSESPRNPRKIGPKLPRFDDRERFIILDKDAVITKHAERVDHGGTHASPRPHLRRGHERILAAERFTLKRGQRIPIRPTYVGDREWDGPGGLKYRVVSRPGSTATQA